MRNEIQNVYSNQVILNRNVKLPGVFRLIIHNVDSTNPSKICQIILKEKIIISFFINKN